MDRQLNFYSGGLCFLQRWNLFSTQSKSQMTFLLDMNNWYFYFKLYKFLWMETAGQDFCPFFASVRSIYFDFWRQIKTHIPLFKVKCLLPYRNIFSS